MNTVGISAASASDALHRLEALGAQLLAVAQEERSLGFSADYVLSPSPRVDGGVDQLRAGVGFGEGHGSR